ncbi:MAG: NRDE family protein [Dongiaceae bacterium]
MCSLVILLRPGADWPVIVAANRDEMLDRPWDPPGRHWPDRPNLVAGRDRLAGGSWLGRNDEGVVAGILNRVDSLGPRPGFRSRGELVLEALDHADAVEAAAALGALDPRAYRSFNLVVADNRDAFWLRHAGPGAPAGRVEVMKLPPGTSMITAHDRNDPASARIRRHLPRFEAAPPPDPGAPDGTGWAGWEALLASREGDTPRDAMAIVGGDGFGTVSSSLLALPAPGAAARPVWRFAAGLPGVAPFRPVTA